MATTTVNINRDMSKYFCDIHVGECFLFTGKLFMKISFIPNKFYSLELSTGKVHTGMHNLSEVVPVNVEINTK